MDRSKDKLLSLEELADMVRDLQQANRIVAMCHGCFDILHVGHVRHFEAARAMADALVVTVTPDCFVNKGPSRPVFPEGERAELVAALKCVDWVAVNRWESAVVPIRLIRPDKFVKGQEYEARAREVTSNFLAEAKAVEDVGGQVAFTHEFTSSSTAAIRRLENAAG